jgi:hypothetical protein
VLGSFGDRLGAKAKTKLGPDLTLPGRPEVFVVGDMIALGGDFAPTLSPRPGPERQPEPERRAGQEPPD